MHCGTKNRVDRQRAVAATVRCAKCHETLAIPPLQHEPLTVTDADFDELVDRSPLPVLLEFWSPYCLYCQRLEPIMRTLALQASDRIRVGKLDIDQNRRSAARYQVHATPTLMVLDRGRELDRVEGALTEEQLRYRLHKYLGS